MSKEKINNDEKDWIGEIKNCVGCGFCCIKATCLVGINNGFNEDGICKGLVWSETEKRYSCKLCKKSGTKGEFFREELNIGKGCCENLNTWRLDVKKRSEV